MTECIESDLLASERATLRSVQSRFAILYVYIVLYVHVCHFCPLTFSVGDPYNV